LVYDIPRYEEKSIYNELSNLGIKVDILNVQREPLPLFDKGLSCKLALIRVMSFTRAYYSSLYFDTLGSYTINSPYTILTCGDKVISLAKLKKYSIPIPKTCISLANDSLDKIPKILKYPLVDKPPIGSWGRMVSLVNDYTCLKIIKEHRELFQDPRLKVHIVQEYIPHDKDYRVLVLGDEILGIICRVRRDEDWRTNVALGGKVESVPKANKEIEELTFKVKEIVKGDFIAVDIIEHDSKYYVIEVNGVPEFKGFMKATGINVPLKIAKYIKEVMKR